MLQSDTEQLVPEHLELVQFDKQGDWQVVVFVEFEQLVVTQLVPVQFLIVQF